MRNAFVVLALLTLVSRAPGGAPPAGASGEAAPAGAAAVTSGTPATTAPAPPRKVTIPPGFQVLTVNGRNVLLEEADKAWATDVLQKIQPTTKPATLPASLLQKLTSQRETLLRQVAIDLALKDLTAAARTYDLDLVAPIRQLDNFRPAVYYLLATPDRMAELMRSGAWSDPRFYYNRAADAVSFNPAGMLNTDRPQDEAIFPAGYDAKATPEQKAEALTGTIRQAEALIQESLEVRARTLVGAQLASIIDSQGVAPLALKDDQHWLGLGIATLLSAKYASMITGDDRVELVKMLTMEHPANPIPGTAIDLIRPMKVDDLRKDMLPAYFDAVRRKSGRAVQTLVEKGGEGAIPKAIAAVRDKKPVDGPELVKVVQDATGVDMTPHLVKGS